MLENFSNIKLTNSTQSVDDTVPTWDLSFMYKDYKDSNIFRDLDRITTSVQSFRDKYLNKLNPLKLSEEELLNAIKEYESIYSKLVIPVWYLELVHSTDTKNEELLSILGKAENKYSLSVKNLSFFENDLSKLDSNTQKQILNSIYLQDYKNFFTNLFAYAPYTLNNDLEELIIEKDLNGRANWQKFREIYESRFKFKFTKNGEEKEYTLSELVLVARRDKDPDTRKKASDILLEKYKENDYVFSFIYNSLIQDYLITNIKRRGYKSPIEKRNIQNQLSNNVVNNLLESVEEHYTLAQSYWNKKAKLVGMDKLKSCDVYAPFPHMNTKKYSFKEAYDKMMSALKNFSPKIMEMENLLFTQKLIDAKPKYGKRGGAYCALLVPGLPSVVFSNFLGSYNDITTIMHEGGHWLHHMLISNNQSLLNSSTPLTTAETASVFFEMILFEEELKRLKKEGTKEKLNAHIMGKIDDIFATVFRQIAFTKFELVVYSKSMNGPLKSEEFADIFTQEYGKLFGNAVDMTEYFRYEWAYIPHFINSPFYVYAYAFGELATIAIYQQYKNSKDKEKFIDSYLEFLASGSSLSPRDLYLKLDIDIESKTIWTESFKYIESLIKEL